jgi:hypothetical protein
MSDVFETDEVTESFTTETGNVVLVERNLIKEFRNQLQQKGIWGERLEAAVADFVKFLERQDEESGAEKSKKSGVSSIGIFWLSGDYKKVTRVEGKKEFQDSDVMNGMLVEPGVRHRDYYKTFFKHNRGRLCVHSKIVELWVGEGCPKSVVDDIKEYFNLREDKYKVVVYRDIGYDKELDIGDRVILLSTGDSGYIENIDYRLDKVRIKSDNGIIFESKIIDIEYADGD